MTDNIFKAHEIRRRVVEAARLENRFEDADRSRANLLKLQRQLAGPTELTKLQQQRLKKRLRGKGGPQQKKTRKRRGGGVGPGRQPDIIDPQLERDILKSQEKISTEKLQLEDIKSQREFVARAGESRQRDIIAQRDIQARDIISQREIAERHQEGALQNRRVNLEAQALVDQRIGDRTDRGIARQRLDQDRDRYDADVRIAEANRDADIGVAERNLTAVQDRVARDDRAHRQEILDRRRLAEQELASRALDREAELRLRGVDAETEQQRIRETNQTERARDINRTEEERIRLSHAREVNLARTTADTDREAELRVELNRLRFDTPPDTFGGGVVSSSSSSSGAPLASNTGPQLYRQRRSPSPRQPAPEPAPEPSPRSSTPPRQRSSTTSSSSSGAGAPLPRPFVSSQRVHDVTRGAAETPVPETTPRALRASPRQTRANQALTLSPSSSLSGGTRRDTGASAGPPSSASSRRGPARPSTPVSSRPGTPDPRRPSAARAVGGSGSPLVGGGSGETSAQRLQRLLATPDPSGPVSVWSTPTTTRDANPSGSPIQRSTIPPVITAASVIDRVEGGPQEPSYLEQAGGAVGAAGRLAGGAAAGVAQGVYEQLPAASDVGAAVGRGGVAVVGGVGSAVYQGLMGAEPEVESIDREDP